MTAVTHLVDLSHEIVDGMVTYPGLPGPSISDHWSFEESREHYDAGTEFHIGRVDMVANTGTYLDTPAHRWRGREDLSEVGLERLGDLSGICVAAAGAIGTEALKEVGADGRAVLFHTGWAEHWGTERYGSADHPFLTEEAVAALVDGGAALVGIDSVNIDDTRGGQRPAHSALLAAGIPIVEHLTGLEVLLDRRFRFFATPPKVRGMGTFPVRAFAIVED